VSEENRYSSIIKSIFLSKFKAGMREVAFEREDIVRFARRLRIRLPKNLGDLVYSFRLSDSASGRGSGEGRYW